MSYLARGRKGGKVEVQFWEITTARLHSVTPLKTEEVMLLTIYFGRRTSKVRVGNILPEGNVA